MKYIKYLLLVSLLLWIALNSLDAGVTLRDALAYALRAE